MSKTRDTGFLGNVVKVDASGNVSFVSGSTTLATINTSGQLSGSSPVLSASYASNAELLDGLDSTVFTLTSSFNAQTASFTAFSSSINSFSASILSYTASQNITNGTFTTTASFVAQTASFTAFTASLNTFSSSILTFTGSAATRLGALESYTSSLNDKTSSFATTGSNNFIGNQVVSGSFTTSGSITSTSTITAQTLVVQTITSSVVYSSGSNIFGNTIGNTQTFTGSVLVTGSLTISTGGNVSAPTIFGSTIACSPIGCFATSCATSFIGGTMSGTTIYGSTAVCSPVGKFSTCLDLGGALTGTSATFSSTVCVPTLVTTNCINIGTTVSLGSRLSIESANDQAGITMYNSFDCNKWSLRTGTVGVSNKGFAIMDDICNATRIQINGAGYVGIGTATPSYLLDVSGTVRVNGGDGLYIRSSAGDIGNIFVSPSVHGMYIDFPSSYYLVIRGSGEFMRITCAGNIGIKTTTPVCTNLVGSMTIVKSYNGDTPTSTTAQTYDINQSNLYLFGRNAGLTLVSNANEESVIAFGNPYAYYIGGIRMGMGSGVAGGDLVFQTCGTCERMRIASAGAATFSCDVSVAGTITSNNTDYTGRYTTPALTLTGGAPGGGGQVYNIGNNGMVGMLVVSIGTQNVAAIFILNATAQPVLVSQSTAETRFSITSGSLNTANVFISGSNLVLNNNIQATRTFYTTFIGKTS